MQQDYYMLKEISKRLYTDFWERKNNLLDHLLMFEPVCLEDLAQELLEHNVITGENRDEIIKFSSKYSIYEIDKTGIIMTGIITVANPFSLGIPFLPNIAGIIYSFGKGVSDLIHKKFFMAAFNLNIAFIPITFLAGSIGYLQQSYLLADSKNLMRFMSYSSAYYLMSFLNHAKEYNPNSKFADLAGIVTKIAGISDIEHFDRLKFARQIYHIDEENLSSVMKYAEKLYAPYLFVGNSGRSIKKYIANNANSLIKKLRF